MLLANFNGKEHLPHRAVSSRQHGFLVWEELIVIRHWRSLRYSVFWLCHSLLMIWFNRRDLISPKAINDGLLLPRSQHDDNDDDDDENVSWTVKSTSWHLTIHSYLFELDMMRDGLVVSALDLRPRGRWLESFGCGLSCSNRGPVALCTLGPGLTQPFISSRGR